MKHYVFVCKRKYATHIAMKFIIYFSRRKTYTRCISFSIKHFVSHIWYTRHLSTCFPSCHFVPFGRRSLCASAFYKKGPARGAKRGAYPSLSIQKKIFSSDEISLGPSYVRFCRVACWAAMRGANIIGVARDGVSGAPRRRWVCGPTSGSRCAL